MSITAVFGVLAAICLALFIDSPYGPCGVNFIVLLPGIGFLAAAWISGKQALAKKRLEIASQMKTVRIEPWQATSSAGEMIPPLGITPHESLAPRE